MMTAKMMMLNWVQETSVRAAVVLSVGLLRLLSIVCVVTVVLSPVPKVPLDLDPGRSLVVVIGALVLGGEGEEVLGGEVSDMFLFAVVGMSFTSEGRKTFKIICTDFI